MRPIMQSYAILARLEDLPRDKHRDVDVRIAVEPIPKKVALRIAL